MGKFRWLNWTVLGLVTLDTRLGALRPDLSNESLPMRLIKSATDTNRQILQLDNGLLQMWRKWKTPAYQVLYDAQQYIETYHICPASSFGIRLMIDSLLQSSSRLC